MLNKSLQKVKFLCFFSNFYFFHVFIYIEDISISVYRRSWMNNMNVDSVKSQIFNTSQPTLRKGEVSANVQFRGQKYTSQDEEKKSGFSIKKATNLAAVLMWLAIVGAGVYRTGLFQKKHPQNIAKKAKNIKEQFEDLQKDLGVNNKEILKDQKFATKFVYKMGRWANNMEKKFGSELYNNLTYAFGTLVVMPLVIWTSPFGKKDSTTSDKFYATIRQPFSVFSTLMLQLTFDKMFDIYLPKIIKNNLLENEKVRNSMKNGEIGIEAFSDIKYNEEEAKRLFKLLPELESDKGGLKNIITKDEAKNLLEIDAFADKKDVNAYIDSFSKKTSKDSEIGKRLSKEQLDVLKSKFKVVTDSISYNKLAKQKPKVVNNVITSAIIGCTFLNVIYGKTLKSFEKSKKNKELVKTEEVKNADNR